MPPIASLALRGTASELTSKPRTALTPSAAGTTWGEGERGHGHDDIHCIALHLQQMMRAPPRGKVERL